MSIQGIDNAGPGNGAGTGLRIRYTALSDLGRVRKDNQDSGYAGPHLLMVADGVGGAAYGDVASHTAVGVMRALDAELDDVAEDPETEGDPDLLAMLADGVHQVHERLTELVAEDADLDGTSTTVTAALFDGHRLGMIHVGDSRAYLLRDGTLRQLTKDHTLVQSLVDEGRISEAEAVTHPHKNLILRAVDGIHEPQPDLFNVEILPGDRLLVCSDGCSGVFTSNDLAAVLGDGSVDSAAVALVRGALDRGSSDNVTVVVADVVADHEPLDPTSAEAAIGPMPVGAAVTIPRKLRGERSRFRRWTGGSGTAQADDTLDPEVLRYAPRAPRRFAWLRRLGVLVVVLAILGGTGKLAYDWTQQQYFVAEDDGLVVIFRGVDLELPFVEMNHVVERSSIDISQLDDAAQQTVQNGISAESLEAARAKVADIEALLQDSEQVSPTPVPPTPTPGTTPTPGASDPASEAPAATCTTPSTTGEVCP